MLQLPKWVLTNKRPAFYDDESVTSIEMTAKLYGAMQTLIEEYNAFAETMEKTINDFMADVNADQETFKIAMRQEFQDFIDTVDLRLQKVENDTLEITQNLINNAIKNGTIDVIENYDPDAEYLNITVTGGV